MRIVHDSVSGHQKRTAIALVALMVLLPWSIFEPVQLKRTTSQRIQFQVHGGQEEVMIQDGLNYLPKERILPMAHLHMVIYSLILHPVH